MNSLKTPLIIILVCVVILLALIGIMKWNAGNTPSTTVASGTFLSVDKTFHDFGEISMAAGTVQYEFPLANTSSEPLVISKISTSCMCTTATLISHGTSKGPFGMPGHGAIPSINESVAPGAKVSVLVEFDPAAHGPAGVGKIQREINLDIAGKGRQKLSIAATVRP